jgi:phosphoribosylglycinamide formyltransferase-1
VKKIAILASGSGSNALKLIQKAQSLSHVSIELIITNTEGAGVLEFAKQYSIPSKTISHRGMGKDQHEQMILAQLQAFQIDWVLLAGYMRVLSSNFLMHFYDTKMNLNRIVNIHPSLLPAYKGLNAFERAYAANDPTSGITVHFVNDGVDEGEIIDQQTFTRLEADTISDFMKRGQDIEHQLYPKFLDKLNKSIIENTHPLIHKDSNEI